jgi:hypothetical protein
LSIAERYSRATRSSHLEWKIEVSDVDYLVAAGMVCESLATRLIRLRSEFDTISKLPHARNLIPMLRGYPVAKAHLGAFALNSGRLDEFALEVAGKVLDAFLDQNCPQCEGRGFNGGYGVPTLRCPACRETGKRLMYWKTDEQEQFGKWLQASIEGKIERAMQDMRRLLRDRT